MVMPLLDVRSSGLTPAVSTHGFGWNWHSLRIVEYNHQRLLVLVVRPLLSSALSPPIERYSSLTLPGLADQTTSTRYPGRYAIASTCIDRIGASLGIVV